MTELIESSMQSSRSAIELPIALATVRAARRARATEPRTRFRTPSGVAEVSVRSLDGQLARHILEGVRPIECAELVRLWSWVRTVDLIGATALRD